MYRHPLGSAGAACGAARSLGAAGGAGPAPPLMPGEERSPEEGHAPLALRAEQLVVFAAGARRAGRIRLQEES